MNKTTKKQLRKMGTAMLAAGILLGGVNVAAHTTEAAAAKAAAPATAKKTVVLKYNGKIVSSQGLYRDGKVWVPVTFLRDTLGMPLSYSKADTTYTLGQGYTKTKLIVSPYDISITVNDFFLLEYNAMMDNNRLYVPVGLLSDYLGYKADWDAASGRVNVLKKAQNSLTVTTATYAKDYPKAPIKLDYPQISGLANSEAEKLINQTIKQTIMNYAANAETEISNMDPQYNPYEFDGTYIIKYNQDGVLSLVLSDYGYTGGAHGNTVWNAFTFSLKDGKRLLLGDLFGANPNYKKTLNSLLSKELKANGGYLGGFVGLNTEKQFFLQDGKVTVFFQPYEYTAYAAGFPQYSYTFKQLLPGGQSPFTSLK